MILQELVVYVLHMFWESNIKFQQVDVYNSLYYHGNFAVFDLYQGHMMDEVAEQSVY